MVVGRVEDVFGLRRNALYPFAGACSWQVLLPNWSSLGWASTFAACSRWCHFEGPSRTATSPVGV